MRLHKEYYCIINSTKNIITVLNKIEKNVKFCLLVESLYIRSFKALDKITTRYVTHMEMKLYN